MTSSAEWQFLPVSPQEVDLKIVLLSGQSFRWRRRHDNPKQLIGVFSHHIWTLEQSVDGIKFKIESPGGDPDNTRILLHKYLQLDIQLTTLYEDWSGRDEQFKKLVDSGNLAGIRLLRQDPVETVFAFICSANNNISRISSMVTKLSCLYGTRLGLVDGEEWFDFPSIDQLDKDDVETTLRKEKFGYRAGYIAKSAKDIVSRGGSTWLDSLKTVGYESARKELTSLSGVGRKVADCICLMALDYPGAIPVDTHIHAVAKKYLPHLTKMKTLTDKSYDEIGQFFREKHGAYAGWTQSVWFASTLKQNHA